MKSKNLIKRVSYFVFVLALALSLSLTALAASSISLDSAKEIAYEDAGISASSVTTIDTLVQYRSGNSYYYKFVFHTADAKYVYIINTSGTIKSSVVSEFHTPGSGWDNGSTGTSDSTGNTVTITETEALDIARSQLNISDSKLKKYDIELKIKKNVYYYEVEFKTISGSEYEFEIDAETGAILDISASISQVDKGGSSISISSEEALSIAMSHAGVSSTSLKKQDVELEADNNTYYYEVELKTTRGDKYEYEIDASTGAILSVSSNTAQAIFS